MLTAATTSASPAPALARRRRLRPLAVQHPQSRPSPTGQHCGLPKDQDPDGARPPGEGYKLRGPGTCGTEGSESRRSFTMAVRGIGVRSGRPPCGPRSRAMNAAPLLVVPAGAPPSQPVGGLLREDRLDDGHGEGRQATELAWHPSSSVKDLSPPARAGARREKNSRAACPSSSPFVVADLRRVSPVTWAGMPSCLSASLMISPRYHWAEVGKCWMNQLTIFARGTNRRLSERPDRRAGVDRSAGLLPRQLGPGGRGGIRHPENVGCPFPPPARHRPCHGRRRHHLPGLLPKRQHPVAVGRHVPL
ncbi:hypothetical protein SGLAU_32415 [Streptomyces glaucescens]|uniref:Uncharacterized protein n=1 Tax=Streptomyces glaucescens TaxID=1907 RepID=A0A089XMI8_STRGA|nr:hypothetical protein SGLAU_32415 [Streptomyces glaucescens]